jgi:hypothetical protein
MFRIKRRVIQVVSPAGTERYIEALSLVKDGLILFTMSRGYELPEDEFAIKYLRSVSPKTPAKTKEKPTISNKYTIVLEDYVTDERGHKSKTKDTFEKMDDAMTEISLRMGNHQIRYIKDVLETDEHFQLMDITERNP